MDKSKKQLIINCAVDLFAKKGIANVSVAMMAKEIGASRGKIYHYFKKGKYDIIMEILQIFEDHVNKSIPDPEVWNSKDTNKEDMLYSLFFQFPTEDSLLLRKIIRIILSEMYFNEQITKHAMNHLITERERLLAECFSVLTDNGKFSAFDTESVARCFNRLLVVYAIEDAVRYPYTDDTKKSEEIRHRMVRDCTFLIGYALKKS